MVISLGSKLLDLVDQVCGSHLVKPGGTDYLSVKLRQAERNE